MRLCFYTNKTSISCCRKELSHEWLYFIAVGRAGAVLKSTFMITIFGYGAPQSDVSAIDLMKSAWGDVNQREMEQIEIIDRRSEDDLRNTWELFIHTHHYETHSSFYDSWIANHPRRTGEAYINQYWNAQFIDNNPIPKNFAFPELWAWLDQKI